MTDLYYQVQYCESHKKLWVHCSSGETVGRFDVRFGMDVHHPVAEQQLSKGQCLDCTHSRPDQVVFDRFCAYAQRLWGIEIDRSKINLKSHSCRE